MKMYLVISYPMCLQHIMFFLKAGLVLPSQLFTLDFLFLLKPICISEAFTEIHVHTFYLLSAVYPVILVIITCILMELHARNCRIIHILWKPFSIILNKTKTTAVTGDAVIQAFASPTCFVMKDVKRHFYLN